VGERGREQGKGEGNVRIKIKRKHVETPTNHSFPQFGNPLV
jgi:hypothetical protein